MGRTVTEEASGTTLRVSQAVRPVLYGRVYGRLKALIDRRNHGKALRILKWMCFSQRPMKYYELLNGVASTPQNPTLCEDSKMVKQALDLCKPLIEELPDGNIMFVHFSVKEHLLTAESIAPIKLADAHHDISFACAATLASALDLVQPGSTRHQRMVQISTGLYDLVPYAADYWVEHLLAYASCVDHLDPDLPLLLQYSKFQLDHDHVLAYTSSEADRSCGDERPDSNMSLDKRLDILALFPIHRLAFEVLLLRSKAQEEPCNTGDGERLPQHPAPKHTVLLITFVITDLDRYLLEHDRTLLTRLLQDFTAAVTLLFTKENLTGISQRELEAFKHSHASSAFRCRYPSCSKAPQWFPSDEIRKRHEVLHQRLFFCKEPSCSWSRIGFQNSAGLQLHVRNFHSEHTTVPIPPKVRREQGLPGSPMPDAAMRQNRNSAVNVEAGLTPETPIVRRPSFLENILPKRTNSNLLKRKGSIPV
ncbi:hypothetical protein K469DRAFT_804454 [Zopfia rhizophila CBS 207.26]|uniref:C2H2-type domain-containing protein n=1 Tax=Zopfia rhizophila CBS 207.26 TaxID=1314779 RepID=A0A6A6EK51_9PEZI|nr:hypothetical protein K469DRAFT_804454 [Zopfia rhizophila CBS 207.26]